MRIRRIAMSAVFAAALAALPYSAAQAQYYDYAPCSSPLAWPFCAAGAVVGAAATIATAPFWLLSGTPPYGYYAPPYYPAPSYYAPAYYAPPATAYAPAQGRNAYYYCPASKAYYPYVATCSVAWRSVPLTPPKP
jgi:hypothetical protein